MGGNHSAAEAIVNNEIVFLVEASHLVACIPQDQPAGMIEAEVVPGGPSHLGIDFDRIGCNAVPGQEVGQLAGAQTDQQRASSLRMKAGKRFQKVQIGKLGFSRPEIDGGDGRRIGQEPA